MCIHIHSTAMLLMLLACVTVASAHQPYESSAVAWLDHARLELTVTVSTEITSRLAGESLDDGAALEKFRPQMQKLGEELYEVTAGTKRLKPERVFFNVRGGETVFAIMYPISGLSDLHFRAVYLDKLPPGYGGSLEIIDEAGKLLSRAPLLRKGTSKDAFSVQLPAAASPPVIAPARTATLPKGNSLVLLVTGVGAVLFLGLIARWQFQRSHH